MRAVVGTAGGADGADGFGADLHSRLVAQRHLGVGKVVVNRAGDADAGDAQLAQTHCALEGAVAADDNQAVDFHRLQRLHGDFAPLGVFELLAARGAQISAGLVGNIQHGVQIQLLQVILDAGGLAQQTVVAVLDANQGHTISRSTAGNGHNGCIHARRIAAGSQDADFSHHGNIPLLFRRL